MTQKNTPANSNISDQWNAQAEQEAQKKVETAFADILSALRIDTNNDHNTKETAKRVAKMYVKELFWGRFQPKPKVTDFPNAMNLDQVYTLGPIQVRSACSHHFAPILGQVWIGILPSDRVIGISKFSRLADWVFARPQIQEEATVMLANEIEAAIKPRGLGIVVKAEHHCMKWRGVKEPCSSMSTSVLRGYFKDNAATRQEFFDLIRGQGY